MSLIISLYWLWLILLVFFGLFTAIIIIIGFVLAWVALFFGGGLFELFKILGSVFRYLAIPAILTVIFLILYLISVGAKIITHFL